jgi:hypothetical protein
MILTIIYAVNENYYHLLMDDREARALIAGTLALMTHFAESRCPQGAKRVRENLVRLSAVSGMPWEFRAALAKLGARWALLEDEATAPAHPSVTRH